jgi:hypothetical protein
MLRALDDAVTNRQFAPKKVANGIDPVRIRTSSRKRDENAHVNVAARVRRGCNKSDTFTA